MVTFTQQLFNGVASGGIYVLVALGITLIFGLTNLVMFAQGELMMIGAYITWYCVSHGVNYLVSALLAFLLLGVLGALLELTVFRRTHGTPVNGFLVSLGLVIIFQVAVSELWGPGDVSILPPFAAVWNIGGVVISAQQVFVLGTTTVVVGGLLCFLRYSDHGRAVRASAEDREAALAVGIPVRLVVTLTFSLGAALSGLAGALLIGLFPVTPFVGTNYIVVAFAIAIVGGLGSVGGAVVIGVLLGIGESIGSGYVGAEWSDAFAFVVILAMLLIRPQGLFRVASGARL